MPDRLGVVERIRQLGEEGIYEGRWEGMRADVVYGP
jgi:hypothetical protein